MFIKCYRLYCCGIVHYFNNLFMNIAFLAAQSWSGLRQMVQIPWLGFNNSLQALLKQDVPNLFLMKFVCHSLALFASYDSKKIPDEVANLDKNMHSYFKYSSKRQTEFKHFQRFTEVKPHKLLNSCQTRWLSLLTCKSQFWSSG